MLTKAALARALGITPVTAGAWVKHGCPLTSEAEARAWAAVRPDGRIKGGTNIAEVFPPKPTTPKMPVERPRPDSTPTNEESLTLDQMLNRLQMAEKEAGDEVRHAAPGADKQAALRAYNQAAKNRVEIESEILRLQRERRELVTPEQGDEQVINALRPVVAKLDTASQSLAYRCNPSDPELAMRVIEEWAEGVKASARQALGEEVPQ